MITFLHGTVSFRQRAPRASEYELCARFSDGIGAHVPVRGLETLQARYHGDLDIERLDDGGMCIRREIIAHGAESALRQAKDLRSALLLTLGYRTNLARGLA